MLPPFSVVIPAFNEAGRIGDTLLATIAYLAAESPQSEIIVVNDGSTDGTGEVVRQVFRKQSFSSARLFENFPNNGKGAAVRKGLLASERPIAAFFDADLSTPIDELPKIIQPVADADIDIAFGSRALDRTLIGDRQPWRREQAGRIFNAIVRVATGLPFWDTQCGFKAFRMTSCRQIIQSAKIIGFGFDVELLLLARRAGLNLREIPVRWNHNEGSKVDFVHDSLSMLREIIALRSRIHTGKYGASLAAGDSRTQREGLPTQL